MYTMLSRSLQSSIRATCHRCYNVLATPSLVRPVRCGDSRRTAKKTTESTDHSLVEVLSDEVQAEKKSMGPIPTLPGFKAELDGTKVSLSKQLPNEILIISFDTNNNQTLDIADEGEEEEGNAGLVSFPVLEITLQKTDGSSIVFTAEYQDTAIDDDSELDQNLSLLAGSIILDSVTFVKAGGDKAKSFNLSLDMLDNNVRRGFITMLTDRGIDEDMVSKLLEFSTAVEHKMYVTVLDNIRAFFAGRE